MKNIKIYNRILLVLILTGIVFLILFLFLAIIKNKQETLILEESKTQFDNEINSLIKLKSATLKQVAYDYTFWDDFVEKINSKDTAWYNNNITTILKSFRIDYVCVYDASFNMVHEAYSDEFISRNFITKDILVKLKEKKFLDYFQAADSGVIEISSASIHPDIDPTHTLTKASGYLFLAKLWNTDFINELSVLSSAKVEILNNTDSIVNQNKYSISTKQLLPDWNNRKSTQLVFTRTINFLNLYHNLSIIMMIIMFSSIISTWLILHFSIRKWINRPLKLVTGILKSENHTQIDELRQCQGEFKLIGNLFNEFIIQKEDLTKAKISAEESNKLKTAFLNNISHEIRTPLNGLLGFLSLLQDSELTKSEIKNFYAIINKCSDRLLNTINDIIEISQIQSGLVKLNISQTNFFIIIDELVTNYKPLAENKSLEFYIKNNISEKNKFINIDGNILKSILSKLIDNAIKYTKSGYIEIGISEKTGYLEFYVKDTGIGIPTDKHQLIFERFMQVDVSDTREFEGSGLGLCIVKAYEELLGGKIWLESSLEKGSTFYFTIPYNENKMETEQIPKFTLNKSKEKTSEKLKILIVEDDPTSELYISILLKNDNNEILVARSGIEAIEIYKLNSDINLILMDIKMHEMSGYDAAKKIRQLNKEVIIIAQSAYAFSSSKIKALEAGCNDYITKPIKKKLLLEMIDMYFNK